MGSPLGSTLANDFTKFVTKLVVIYTAAWVTFKPKSKKILIFQEMELPCPPKKT